MKNAINRCPNCRKDFFNYGNDRRFYGSPVRTCGKCNAQYIDRRYHEIALEGIPADDFSKIPYVVLIVAGAFILYRGIHLTKYKMINCPEDIQWVMPAALIIIGLVMTAKAIIDIIMITTGKKAQKFEKLRYESEERMLDKSYAWTLKRAGYNVPDRYL